MLKWIILPLLIITTAGCNDGAEEEYNNFFNSGLDYIVADDLIRAEVYFEQALEKRPDDARAMTYINQIQYYQKALEHFNTERYEESLEQLDYIINTENGSSGIVSKAQYLIEKVELEIEERTAIAKSEAAESEKESETAETEETESMDEEIEEGDSLPNELLKSDDKESADEMLQNDEELDNSSHIIEAYNNLSLTLKVILAATTVDDRAMTPELLGFNLYYNFDEDTLFVNVHSGAGTGHPWYALKYDNETITPMGGVVWVGAEGYHDTYVNPTPVSKIDLYNRYIASKESYDIAVSRVYETDYMDFAEYQSIRSEF